MAHKRRYRDERGWAIPAHNTISYHIYLSLVMGLRPAKIAKALNLKLTNVAVLAWAIRHPEIRNETQKKYYRNARERRAEANEATP